MENKDKILLKLARMAILDKINGENSINKDEFLKENSDLASMGATFVTLAINGELRGCIGSLVAHKELFDDIVSNAVKAAFDDPRFPALSIEEFKNMKIEISILGEAKRVKYSDFNDLKTKLVSNEDGVILKQGLNQATFLPQVWEQLPTFEEFIVHLYQKAGIDISQQTIFPFIYTYRVRKIEE